MNINDLPQGSYTEVQPQRLGNTPLNINSLPQGSYTDVTNQTPDQPVQQPSDSMGFLGSNAGSPFDQFAGGIARDLVARPALRFGQALGAGAASLMGASPENIQAAAQKDTYIPGFGTVEGQKPAQQGGANQVLGQAIRVGTELLPYEQIAGGITKGLASSPMLANTLPRFALKGLGASGAGALGGYGFDVSSGVEQGKSASDTFTPGMGTAIGAVLPVAGSLIGKTGGAIGQRLGLLDRAIPTVEQVDQNIAEQYQKAIRPSVSGKGTFSGRTGAIDDAVEGVKRIVENKPNLTLLDANGEPTNSLPKTVSEFSQSIEQTKKGIFDKYNAKQVAAGKQGAVVQLGDTASEVLKISNDPVVQDSSPTTAEYAKRQAKSLGDRKIYTSQQAQDAIKIYNDRLNAYYKNPTPEGASNAAVDAMIVNRLRQGLDESITSAEGEGYQQLKNDYGQVKSLEKDVNHRAIVEARKANKGMIDFTDIFSASDIVKGVITQNPTAIAQGGMQKAVALYYKYLNNPNTIIEKMFQQAESGLPSGGSFPRQPVQRFQPAGLLPAAGESGFKGVDYYATPKGNVTRQAGEARDIANVETGKVKPASTESTMRQTKETNLKQQIRYPKKNTGYKPPVEPSVMSQAKLQRQIPRKLR